MGLFKTVACNFIMLIRLWAYKLIIVQVQVQVQFIAASKSYTYMHVSMQQYGKF